MTVVSPFVATCVYRAATDTDKVADMAASVKEEKYLSLSSTYTIQPITIENLGALSSSIVLFLNFAVKSVLSLATSWKVPTYLCCCLVYSSVQCFCMKPSLPTYRIHSLPAFLF